MKITKRSSLTGIEHTREIDVTIEQLDAWINGGLMAQDAFPHLSANDREFLISGVTPEEWEATFGEEE